MSPLPSQAVNTLPHTCLAVQMLERSGFDFSFINATQPTSVEPLRRLEPPRVSTPAEFMSFKELGCALSHADTIQQGLLRGYDAFLILEDDVAPSAAVKTRTYILEALNEVPADFDVLFLGWCMEACELTANLTKHLQSAVGPLCAHAYIVSRSGAEKLLLRMLPASEPNDVVLRKMLVDKELKGFKTRQVRKLAPWGCGIRS